jgi:hypothetical protein
LHYSKLVRALKVTTSRINKAINKKLHFEVYDVKQTPWKALGLLFKPALRNAMKASLLNGLLYQSRMLEKLTSSTYTFENLPFVTADQYIYRSGHNEAEYENKIS